MRKCCSAKKWALMPGQYRGIPFAAPPRRANAMPGRHLSSRGPWQAWSQPWSSQPAAGCAPAATGRSSTVSIPGEPVIRPSLATFVRHADIALVQPVIHPDDTALFRGGRRRPRATAAGFGGATRQASVRAGLEALAPRIAGNRAGARRRAAVRLAGADRARHRGRASDRRRHSGHCRRRHGEDASTQRGRVTGTIDRSAAAPGADAAGVRLRCPARRAPARAAPPAARISPTTPRSPNGPG